jgi:phosphoribosylaminoimidazolecarboxamide formyltransferase/IMP cyclohydrolase
MNSYKVVKTALISVYHKDNLDKIVKYLGKKNVTIYSTGGTMDFIKGLGVPVLAVEELTGYPSILGGRVKTLHPKVFGGILARRDNENDLFQLQEYSIPEIDLVIVDLYPFEKTVESGASEPEVIEKIDIGGISLIRAAAKNFRDVLIVSNREQYERVYEMLTGQDCATSLEQRRVFAAEAFATSSHYDTAIYSYFSPEFPQNFFRKSLKGVRSLRYGENPHQKGVFYGNFDEMFEQYCGKEISYNNLLDIDAAVNLNREFEEPTIAILKHNNACGVATRPSILQAWVDALAGDPVSAFGGIIISNRLIDEATAKEINKIFFEVLIAPGFDNAALEILQAKKNRIILRMKDFNLPQQVYRTALNGVLMQERDSVTESDTMLQLVTQKSATPIEVNDLLFANKIVKHTKSNAIVLVKNLQLVGSGVGQTSRVDAVKQAIAKAQNFGFDLNGAVMASDAFFPFPDSVQLAYEAGVRAVIQPGGSIKDQDSIDFCNANGIAMIFTGIRHFKH